jgi:two-component system, LytTR family, sensor kinase
MNQRKIKYLHLFIWLFAIFANLPYADLNRNLPPQQIVTYFIAFLYLMLVFYLFYLLLAPKFLNSNKIGTFFGLSFLVVLIMPFIGYTLLYLIRAIFEGGFHNFLRGYSAGMHMSAFFPVMTAALFGSFFRVIINWFTSIDQKAELDRQKLAVELDLLKSKLNPHFLFNTLNNIDSLIRQNAEEASAALIKLSEMMRYLTYETSADTVELRKEVDYIVNFIDLHRIRIKSPEDIIFKAEGDMSIKIAPALFIPVIENAFKFATFRNCKPCIDITLSSHKGIVVLYVSNSYEIKPVNGESVNSGYGIINLRRRLDLTYPANYLLSIEPGESKYNVKLTIDTNANQLYRH